MLRILPDLAQTLRDLAVQEWLHNWEDYQGYLSPYGDSNEVPLANTYLYYKKYFVHHHRTSKIYCCCISGGHVQEEQEKVETEWKRQAMAYGVLRYPESNGYGNQQCFKYSTHNILLCFTSPLIYITPRGYF